MTSDRSLENRVTRLENDVESIYDLITEVKATQDGHTRTLDGHTRTLAEHTRTLDQHTRTLAEHTARFDAVDTTLAEILRRLPEPS